jgi:hypothetical protein
MNCCHWWCPPGLRVSCCKVYTLARLIINSICDILTQWLIGLIEYSYHQDIPYFTKDHLQRTLWLSMIGPEQFQNGWPIEKFHGCAWVRTNMRRKDRGWFVGLVYDPSELTGLTTARTGVAGVLQLVSEPTLTVSRARTSQLGRIQ